MSFLKNVFNVTDKVLDLVSLTVHGGMLLNGLSHQFAFVKPLQDTAMQQVNLLKAQRCLQNGVGKQVVDFVSKGKFANLKFQAEESIFTSEGFAKSGMLGLAELSLTGTHLSLAYPIAKLCDTDGNINNSTELLIAFGAMAALDIAHWATSGEESTPEHH